ncbi:MAG: single-stranded DNA-binding protein [Methanomassiliicoccales archaeon]|jgi:replication factor A1|nr:single-stranded DNA-binding protein [Methanomassiliicoccales archaeon]
MEKQELAPHVTEISRVLGNKVSEEQIAKELDTYLNLYRVSLETAKRSVVRKLGGDPNALNRGSQKKLSEVSGTEQNVDLLVKVLSANRKEIEQNGEVRTLIYGLMADETGTLPYTAWDADRFQLERGQVLLVRNAYSKEWNGKPQLNLGTRATIEQQPQDAVKLPEGMDVPVYGPSVAKVADLQEGMNSVTITAKVLQVETRKIETQDGPKTVYSGMMADETGRVQFSSWHDFNLKKDEVVRIQGAYVRSWRGIPQLNFGERGLVERVPGHFPADLDLYRSNPRSIDELERVGGAFDVLVLGTVVDIKKGSGLIQRCPQCNRLVQNKLCRLHGKVEGQYDLRIKAVVDDGAGAITAVLNKEITEELVGITLEQAIKEAKEAMDPEVVMEKVEERLLAKPMEVRGNVISDDYGLMMIVSEARLSVPEVRNEAARLLAELEGSQ